jgi:hypothetical protein
MSSSTRRRTFSSLSNTVGRCSAADSGSPTSTSRSRATAMASSTVSAGNRRASWNERPSPRLARAWGLRSVMSLPPSTTTPPSAGVNPDTTSNSVVLPAPLGPMIPTISPGATARSTASRARMPPKLRDSSRTSRAAGPSPDTTSVLCDAAAARLPLSEPDCTCAAAAAPSRNTDRSTSGRSSSSDVGPWKRISPFSMK